MFCRVNVRVPTTAAIDRITDGISILRFHPENNSPVSRAVALRDFNERVKLLLEIVLSLSDDPQALKMPSSLVGAFLEFFVWLERPQVF